MKVLTPYLEKGESLEVMAEDEKVKELFSGVKNLKKGIRDHLNRRGYKTIDGIPTKKNDIIQHKPKEIRVPEPTYNTPNMPFNINEFMVLKEMLSSNLVERISEIEKKLDRGEDIFYTLDTTLVDNYKPGNSTKSMRVNDKIWKEFNEQLDKHKQLRMYSKGEALNILFSNIIYMMKEGKL